MKKVLIITYYWPPSGGAGVQRWLKFSKYCREFGWEPIIYTPENPESPALDHSLSKDVPGNLQVLKSKIWEPYSAYKQFVGRKPGDKIKTGFLSEKEVPSRLENLSVWIRGNFFIPDARKFWIRPSIKYLNNYLSTHQVDAMVSTGPPHSMHLIALGVKKKLNIPWLADFRDPWTNIDFYDKLKLSSSSDRKHKDLEKQVLQNADRLVTVSWNWANDFLKLGAKSMEVVTNGFDPDDFQQTAEDKKGNFEIFHLGSMNADRNPFTLWKILKEKCQEDAEFKNKLTIKLIGQSDFQVKKSIQLAGLEKNTSFIPYMEHQEALNYARKANVLLLPLNDTPNVLGIIPGKLFEYLGLNRPVLCVGPLEGDSARILSETGAGQVVGFKDLTAMKNVLNGYWSNFKAGKDTYSPDSEKIAQYSRKQLTGSLCGLLDEMI